jgi:hypothetical protein
MSLFVKLILPIAHAKSRKNTGQLRIVVQLFNRPRTSQPSSSPSSASDQQGEIDPAAAAAAAVSAKLDPSPRCTAEEHEAVNESTALEPSVLQSSTVEFETVTTSMFLDSSHYVDVDQSDYSYMDDVIKAPSHKSIDAVIKDSSHKSIDAGPIMISSGKRLESISAADDTLSPLNSYSNIMDKSTSSSQRLLPPRSRFGFPFLSSHSVTSDTPSSQADSSLFESDDTMSNLLRPYAASYDPSNASLASSYSSAEEDSWSNMDQLVLTIYLVAAIELVPAHLVTLNSPIVTIGCGKKTAILPVSLRILQINLWMNGSSLLTTAWM